jgi:hypothetical protein
VLRYSAVTPQGVARCGTAPAARAEDNHAEIRERATGRPSARAERVPGGDRGRVVVQSADRRKRARGAGERRRIAERRVARLDAPVGDRPSHRADSVRGQRLDAHAEVERGRRRRFSRHGRVVRRPDRDDDVPLGASVDIRHGHVGLCGRSNELSDAGPQRAVVEQPDLDGRERRRRRGQEPVAVRDGRAVVQHLPFEGWEHPAAVDARRHRGRRVLAHEDGPVRDRGRVLASCVRRGLERLERERVCTSDPERVHVDDDEVVARVEDGPQLGVPRIERDRVVVACDLRDRVVADRADREHGVGRRGGPQDHARAVVDVQRVDVLGPLRPAVGRARRRRIRALAAQRVHHDIARQGQGPPHFERARRTRVGERSGIGERSGVAERSGIREPPGIGEPPGVGIDRAVSDAARVHRLERLRRAAGSKRLDCRNEQKNCIQPRVAARRTVPHDHPSRNSADCTKAHASVQTAIDDEGGRGTDS